MSGELHPRFLLDPKSQVLDTESSRVQLSVINRGQCLESDLADSRAPEAVAEPLETSENTATGKKPYSFYLAFLGLNVMVFIVTLDATTLSVAIPIIAEEQHGTTLESFWASISFLLAVVVTQPIYTSFSDVFGRMIPLYIAFLLFGIGSIVFAMAQSMAVVILGRVLQDLGGGGLDVLGEIIVADITSLKERPLYLGLLAIPMAAGSVLGPIIGAAFAEYATWRWIGWINLPLVGIGFLLIFFFLRLRPIDQSVLLKLEHVDWFGMLLFAIGLTSFILPLSWGGSMYSWQSWQTILPLVLGLFVLVGFGFYESRPFAPVFPYHLFRSATALTTLFGSFVHGLIVYCLVLYLPIYFQGVRLQEPVKAAISAFPLSFTVIPFSCLSAIAVEFFRRYRWNIWLGWIFLPCGLGLMSLLDRSSSVAAQSGFQVIAGLGIGTLYCVLVIPMQASAPSVDDTGLAVGMLVFFRLFGTVVGLALGSATFNNVFKHHIASIGPLPPSTAILENSNEAIGFIPSLRSLNVPPATMAFILEAYMSSIRAIWLIMAGLGAVGCLTSLFTKELTLEKDDVGRQRFEPSSRLALLKSIIEYFQAGHILPVRPTKVFSAASLQDLFRYMQKGQHMGKIIVSMRDTATTTKLETAGSKQRKKTFQLDQTASYLLVGGLGGLGRAISAWMVEHGARHLIYLSRSAGLGVEDQAFFRELESQGCGIQLVKGSVSNIDDVRRAVNGAHYPLRGILQMSMVLRDQAFPRMSHDEWNAATTPKVQGTSNLHYATMSAGVDLDFFVLFSSMSGVIGQPGQANYAAANTFLEAFVQYRTSLSLPASVIDIGAVEDVGYIAQSEGLLRKMKAAGAYGIREQELLDALMLAMIPPSESKSKSNNPGFGFIARNDFVLGLCSTIPLSNAANRAIWKKDRRMAAYHNSVNTADAASSTASNDSLKSFLATARGDPSILKAPESSALLANEIGKKLFDFLLLPEEDLDTSRSLADVGMDSLIAIEMRSWWKQVFGFDISVLEMLGMGTLDALGAQAAAGLLKLAGGEAEENVSLEQS